MCSFLAGRATWMRGKTDGSSNSPAFSCVSIRVRTFFARDGTKHDCSPVESRPPETELLHANANIVLWCLCQAEALKKSGGWFFVYRDVRVYSSRCL